MRGLLSEVADVVAALVPAAEEDEVRVVEDVVEDPDPAAARQPASLESPRPRSSSWTARRPSVSRRLNSSRHLSRTVAPTATRLDLMAFCLGWLARTPLCLHSPLGSAQVS